VTKIPSQCSAFVVCALLTITTASWAQSPSGTPVVIDGSKNPTAISDGTAYSLLFLSLLPSPSESQVLYTQRVGSRIEAIGLTTAQGQSLLAAAKQFHDAVNVQDTRTAQARSAKTLSLTEALQLRAERESIANAMASDLQQQLGADAATKLMTYLAQEVKTHIRTIVRLN
jgi:hypothetical protein